MSGLQPEYSGDGRAIYVQKDGTLYRAHHYDIYQSKDRGKNWNMVVSIPRPLYSCLIEPIRLVSRLFRHEVRAFLPLKNGGYVAATRTGVFHSHADDNLMKESKVEVGNLPSKYPMTISCDKQGRIIWGEYWENSERRGVRIFASDDNGLSFHMVYSFKAGETLHIHNIMYDESINKFWVFAGDHSTDPGIGLLDDDFSHFEWIRKGKQIYRTVWAFNIGDHLIYATDTEVEENGIYILNKKNGETEHICEINGSCIYGTRCGKYYVISTTAEPITRFRNGRNPIHSSIWISTDGYNWRNEYTRDKDLFTSRWSYILFQFGSLVLPRGENDSSTLMFSGQALKNIDGKVYIVHLASS